MYVFLTILTITAFAGGETYAELENIPSDIFKTTIISNEFLVQYQFKYWIKTRKKFLRASFIKSNIYNWTIIPRNNPASRYPSDFDVVQITDLLLEKKLSIIKSHPVIRNIVPHRCVLRLLNSYNESNFTHMVRKPNGIAQKVEPSIVQPVTSHLHANVLWKFGITGKGIRVAVFDTGLTKNHPHFRNVKERTNWTNEKSLDDGVSHGTFVAGVIASSKECLGFAPDAELHIYRVFTNSQVSYTSWFLDAFNYAIFKKINVLNLSIGGPDFLDQPFVEKVLELSANRVIMVSAIGNDGPLYGTLNNPADQSDVIGVGGIGYDDKLSKFSSRGMTTWELPLGYGRVKPDIVTYGSKVEASDVKTGCRPLSGTSVSSPVVAGAVALITSGVLHKFNLVNPASLKQVLLEGATKLSEYNMFEQGYGKLNIIKSMALLLTYKPKITLSPPYLDFSTNYMWPYSSQPLFFESMPIIINVTILNGISVSSKIIEKPIWYSYVDSNGNLLNVTTIYSPIIWPWTGWIAIFISVVEKGRNFEGFAKGHVSFSVENSFNTFNKTYVHNITFPINVRITSTPPRHRRILWDQYHSLRYPPGYIPRDNLKLKSDPLDWRADHIHTNFRDMYNHLRNSGYYVDILREPYTCFNASAYGTLLIVDPEEEFFDEEIISLENDVYDIGLSVIIFADWYNTTVMKKIQFFDENTRQWWIPDTGGANIPALNELIKPYGLVLSDFIAEGHFKLGDHPMYYASGTTITSFPNNIDDIIIGAALNEQSSLILKNLKTPHNDKIFLPILGLFQTNKEMRKTYKSEDYKNYLPQFDEINSIQDAWNKDFLQEINMFHKRVLLNTIQFENVSESRQPRVKKEQFRANMNTLKGIEGRIVIYGDSNCLDSTHLEKPCFWLLNTLLDYAMNSHKSSLLKTLNRSFEFQRKKESSHPLRLSDSNLYKYSKVLNHKSKFKKSLDEKCEHLTWEPGINVNSSHLLKFSISHIEESRSKYSEDKIFLDLLALELKTISPKEFNKNYEYDNFYMRKSLLFLFSLTIFVFMLFVSFVRRRFKK